MEVIFNPEASRAEVAALYPGATCHPLLDPAKLPAVLAEAAELPELVTLVGANSPDAERAEALVVALADPEVALACWRALAIAQKSP
jgi:hypothetical protein